MQKDLAITLPVLARLERRGGMHVTVPNGYDSWKAFEAARQVDLRQLVHDIRSHGITMDVARATKAEVVDYFKDVLKKRYPRQYFDPALDGNEEYERLVTHFPIGKAITELRANSSDGGIGYWLSCIAAAHGRLRGVQALVRTGRWYFRDPALNSLPKHGAVARQLRSGLAAPSGHVLIAADWRGFEARILGSLSGDEMLLRAARTTDIHRALAEQVFRDSSDAGRERAKVCIYGLVYGQTERGFWSSRAEMPIAQAKADYRAMVEALPGVAKWKAQALQDARATGYVITEGG